MIFCNLKVLLAQRNITISKMSSDTNISRTTLTALCSNKSGGIQFDTLDNICSYLKVLPDEVILFSPYQVEFFRNNEFLDVKLTNRVNNKHFYVTFILDADYGSLYLSHDLDEEQKFQDFKKILSSLPKYYISQLNDQIKQLYSDYSDTTDLSCFNIETNFY